MLMDAYSERWTNGPVPTITVGFTIADPDPLDPDYIVVPAADLAFRDRIINYVTAWEPFANIRFEFVGDDIAPNANVRIAFVNLPRTSFSAIGRDSVGMGVPSMKLQRGLGAEEGSVVMHEFGHVLGARHEHQRTDTGIIWHENLVIQEYNDRGRNTAGDVIESNVVGYALQGTTLVDKSPYDPLSIMHYPIPAVYNSNTPVIPRNHFLSKWDKAWIARYYPHPQPNIGAVLFTTTPNRREVISQTGQILIPISLTYGLVGLDVPARQDFRVGNNFDAGAPHPTGIISARVDFLETAADNRTFQVGTFNATPNKPDGAPNPDRFDHAQLITFHRRFVETDPVVIVWLHGIDASRTESTRIRAYASGITGQNFTLRITSFGNSGIRSVGVSWVAFPKDMPGTETGSVQPANSVTKRKVKFTDINFTRDSKVLIAVNQLDFAPEDHIQFKVSASNMSKDGMDLEVGRNVGATFLAIAKIKSPPRV